MRLGAVLNRKVRGGLIMDLDQIFKRIGIDRDYSTMEMSDLSVDLQGWGSTHPIFAIVIQAQKPLIVVEVGTWKGASVIHMAKIASKLGLATKFICVDTWLGSNVTLWISDEYRKMLMLRHGYPTMFRQFIRNITGEGVADSVFPLPMTSSAAYHLLKRLSVFPDVTYIDAGHEEEEVYRDLALYYDLLKPGGVIFGDDYMQPWPGVIAAVNRFCAEKRVLLNSGTGKFMFKKPD